MNNKVAKIIFISLMMIFLQACFVAKEYKRPEVINHANFRTDNLPDDSLTIANISWREMFTDSVLQKYIEKGLQNNIDIRIALEQISAAEAYFKQGKASFFPTFGLGANVTHQELSNNSQFGALFNGSLTQYDITGNLSWEADIWGKIRSGKRAFQASYLQSVAAHKAVKTELISNIASVYYQLLAFDEQLNIAQKTLFNRQGSLETIKALKEAGSVTEVGVKQTEAQMHSARALITDIELNIKLLENTLSILLGEAPKEIKRSILAQQKIEIDLKTGYPVQLLRNRPDVIAAEFNLINAFELTNVAKSNFYPSLRLTASGGLQSLELDELLSVNSLFATIIGSLTQPIFNARQIRTQYEVALSQQEQALLNFKWTVLNASREVSNAMYSYETAVERIDIKKLEFEANDTAAQYSEELLNYGFANYLEVLTARENALSSELSLVNSEFTKLNSTVELYRALGGGWK